ncbi:MAG: sigma 54-interacting transcriptional regulator [Deltaproteobacteria bacterium]|nr:sigma 54-interacting transcriptional regulator [Deltaproteobacteria bacterium]
MPSLRHSPKSGSPIAWNLFKNITTLGSSPEADVSISFDPAVATLHAQLHRESGKYAILPSDRASEVQVNGKKVKRHVLQDGDLVKVGSTELRFTDADAPEHGDADDDETPGETPVIAAATLGGRPVSARQMTATLELQSYRRLQAFSQRLVEREKVTDQLDLLLDEAVALTQADKGFIVLMEEGGPQVVGARNMDGATIANGVQQLSDSILKRVVDSKKPLIVSDALKDENFNAAESVVNLKLCSVICAPLIHRGDLFGVLYLGNDRVASLFDERSLELLSVFASHASLLVKQAQAFNELKTQNQVLKERLESNRYGDVVGSCDSMKEIFRKIDKVAGTDISVLVTGETGTGKELIARELHRRSSRARGPLVVINCGAIPENLLESELFGHVRGAFTGAVNTRMGKFQSADKGTLFLDEIGEMPLNLQVKILRALQERVVVKVGDTRPEPVDIRVVAATHRNLEADIKGGKFREDLYYRLNVVQLHLPPLRERGEDIVTIARYLLQKHAREVGAKAKGFSPECVAALRKGTWPGNIRQLENRIKRAVVLAEKAMLSPEDMDLGAQDMAPLKPLVDAKDDFERRYINDALARNGGNRTQTARDLGVDPRTIYRHLERERAEKVARGEAVAPLEPGEGEA